MLFPSFVLGLGGTWARCLVDATPEAIVAVFLGVFFFMEVSPEILQTKAAAMEGKIRTPREANPPETRI